MTLDLSDDEEIGEFIYRTSHTAKLLREQQEREDEEENEKKASIQDNITPTVKVDVKPEDDASTDDEHSLEYVVSSSSAGYDPVKSEETDNEELWDDKDTNTSNKQNLPIKEESNNSTDDGECSERRRRMSPRTAQPKAASYVQESVDAQRTRKRRYCSKRKRESKEESNGSVQKAARIECSLEGCTLKAADSGTCWKHKGYNHCSQGDCTNRVWKGGVCRSHKEFATFEKAARIECSVEGCTGKAADSGTCKKKHKGYDLCSHEGCTNRVKKGGVCLKHGAVMKTCSHEGCTNRVQKGGLCIRHGAVLKTCSYEGCTNYARGKEGVCIRHGAKVTTCSHDGCTNKVVNRGVCVKHGAILKICSIDGCSNNVIQGGVCIRHGAVVKRKKKE